MKYLMYTVLGLILFSCSAKKSEKENEIAQSQEQLKEIPEVLSEEESNIINDFLQVELASDKYKNRENLEIVLIEEAANGIGNLDVYEFAYNDWHCYGNDGTAEDNKRLGWILDSTQVRKLKEKYKYKKGYKWKSTDIKNYTVTIMKSENFRNIIKTGQYSNLPEKLILYITLPLKIDKNNTFIGFVSGSSLLGFRTINSTTVLMKKVNEKWIKSSEYWDGIME